MERNPMPLKAVRGDTRFAMEAPERVQVGRGGDRHTVTVYRVLALKKCGCNGPYLGQVQSLREADWPEDFQGPTLAPRGHPTLWAAFADGPHSTPVAYAWKREDAAAKLRSWWATRNVKAVLKRRETINQPMRTP